MIDPDQMAKGFERNTWIIKAQADGLSHEDSLIQTPYNINCLNWTLGHLLEGRGILLETLGRDRVVTAEETSRYRRESEPILEDGPEVLSLDRLLDALEESGARIGDALRALDRDAMDREVDTGDGKQIGLGKRVHFQYFHDTYHTGQTELLRQVAGIGDKVI